MERLTKRLSSGAPTYNYPASCYFDDDSGPDKIAQSAFRQRCVERLTDYEDTGLTPEEVLPKDKADEIANLKADLDTLRNKLADTEAALGRANAEVSRMTVGCRQVEEERDYMHQQWSNAEQRANYAESHPWRNLWVWVKRKVARHE